MTRARMCALIIVLVAVAAACSSSDKSASAPDTTMVPPTTLAPNQARVAVSGTATLDGAPFDAEFLGAVVRRNGLVTPCQYALPPINNGRFEIPVMAEVEAAGCGVPGAEILLWTFAKQKQYFSSKAVAWPADGRTATFDPTFSSAKPNGDIDPRTEIAAEVFENAGTQLGDGTRVEAYIGDTLCGVATVRTSGDFTGVSLSVVGPDSIAGCTRNATIHFRVDGRQAVTTAVNRFRAYRSLEITMP